MYIWGMSINYLLPCLITGWYHLPCGKQTCQWKIFNLQLILPAINLHLFRGFSSLLCVERSVFLDVLEVPPNNA